MYFEVSVAAVRYAAPASLGQIGIDISALYSRFRSADGVFFVTTPQATVAEHGLGPLSIRKRDILFPFSIFFFFLGGGGGPS
jgi:hypothetical protein